MRVSNFDYNLPPELIAQRPLKERDGSRLLLLQREGGMWEDQVFADLPKLLRGDELVVFNNARVLPARLYGVRAGAYSQLSSEKRAEEHLPGEVEIFLTR